MEITAIEKDKRKKGILSVYIDGDYSFSIKEDDYLGLNLYEKKQINPEELSRIKRSIVLRRAKTSAIKYLSFKLRSEKEIINKLEREGFRHDIIDEVTEELKSLGYINDKLYAQKFVYDRSKLKPESKRMLKLELKNRGVPDDTIDEVLSEWKADDIVVAEGIARKRFGKYNLDDQRIIRRLSGFLLYRGFNAEVVNKVIERLKNKPD